MNRGPVFKGNTDGMKGNVFQCHGEHTDKQQFTKTVGVLEEHINKTFTYPQDIASLCKTFGLTTLVQPPNLTDDEYKNDMGKKMMWEETMKTYIKRVNFQESNKRAPRDMEASILYQKQNKIKTSRFRSFVFGFPASKWSPKDAQDNFDP